MRRFRLNLFLLIAISAACFILAGYLSAHGKMALALAAGLSGELAAGILMLHVRRPIHLMSAFVAALENNDRTMRFDSTTDDRELNEISRSMDRIMTLYRGSQMELETRKLYYDRILRIMTHEMRNSITPVIALAADYAGHPEKYDSKMLAETMEVIGSQAESIKRFLDAYYNLTHLPEPRRTDVVASDFLNHLRTLTALEEKRRGFDTAVCHFSCPVDMKLHIDSDLMMQALMNLVRNALDAVADTANPNVEIGASISDGESFITVADNGPGLPNSVKSNLFQPFLTTKKGGSGIGLSLSRQIARLHGGDLFVSSHPNRKTIFTLSIGKQA